MPQRRYGRNLRMAGARESPLCGLSPLAMDFPRGAAHRSPKQSSPVRRMGEFRRMDDVRERFQNLHEFLKVARFKLNRNNWDYIVGGTETETTLARNRQSLDCIAFKPRVLRNVQNVDCSTELYGRKIRLPVLIAPVGGLQQFWEGGVATVAEAAGEFGIPMMQSFGNRAAARGGREAGAGRVQDLPALCARRRQVRRRFLQALAGCGLRAAVLLHGRSRALFAARARHGQTPRPHRQPQRGGASQSGRARLGHDRPLPEALPEGADHHQGHPDRRGRAALPRARHRRHLRDQSRRARARSRARRDGHPSRRSSRW